MDLEHERRLAALAIVLDDWLRYWLWGEERPHYMIF